MTSKCSIELCDKPAYARGWCKNHYQQAEYHGAFNPKPKAKAGAHERFLLEHVGWHSDECLIWPHKLTPAGYGKIVWRKQNTSAHRQMCKLAHGEPPTSEHHAAHSCKNGKRGCISPRHLRWVASTENNADKVLHGTDGAGERNPSAKLTAEQAIAISRSQERPSELARKYPCDVNHIRHIRRGGAWSSVTGIQPKKPRARKRA